MSCFFTVVILMLWTKHKIYMKSFATLWKFKLYCKLRNLKFSDGLFHTIFFSVFLRPMTLYKQIIWLRSFKCKSLHPLIMTGNYWEESWNVSYNVPDDKLCEGMYTRKAGQFYLRKKYREIRGNFLEGTQAQPEPRGQVSIWPLACAYSRHEITDTLHQTPCSISLLSRPLPGVEHASFPPALSAGPLLGLPATSGQCRTPEDFLPSCGWSRRRGGSLPHSVHR